MLNSQTAGMGFHFFVKDEATLGMAKIDKAYNNLMAKVQKFTSKRFTPTVALGDKASGPLNNLKAKLDKLSGVKKVTFEAVDRISGKLKGIFRTITSPLAMLGAGAGVGALFAYPLKFAGEMEQANISMTTLLGNADKAKKMQEELINFAIKTPFEMPQLRDATKMLLAFKFSQQDIIPILTGVGDAASGLGLGADGIQRIVLALGQMKAKSKVSGQEMMQLTEAGVPAWDILANAMHISTQEVMKLSEKGLIPADIAIKHLVLGMEQNFPRMMDKQSRSLFGLLSTLKDFANIKIFGAFGEGLRQGLIPGLKKLTDSLTENDSKMKKMQENLTNIGRQAGKAAMDALMGIYGWLNKIFNDPKFQKLSWGDKILYMIDQALDAVDKWLSGPGGAKMEKIFTKLGAIAAKAWGKALIGSLKMSGSSLMRGDFMGALLGLGGFLKLGGGSLIGGAFKLGKMGMKGAKFLKGGKGLTEGLEAASNVNKTIAATTEAGAMGSKVIFGANGQILKTVAPLTEAATVGAEGLGTGAKMMGMLSTGGKFLGKAAMPIAIGAEALSVLTAKDKMRAGVTGAAGLGGMWAGAKLGAMGGAMLGSIVPVIGTGIGAAVGGILGGAIGYFGTKWAAGKIYDASTQKKNPQIQQQQQQQVKVIKEETKKIITRQPIKLILDGRVLTETVLEFMDEKTVRKVGAYG